MNVMESFALGIPIRVYGDKAMWAPQREIHTLAGGVTCVE